MICSRERDHLIVEKLALLQGTGKRRIIDDTIRVFSLNSDIQCSPFIVMLVI